MPAVAPVPVPPLTVREYSYLTVEIVGIRAYGAYCERLRLCPTRAGYGLLHCADSQTQRWTLVTPDIDYVRLYAELPKVSNEPVAIILRKFLICVLGWPDEWGL